MTPLRLFCIFHLNLAYSSIGEERRGEVVERCYWPLLRLARRRRLPFGIEATAATLEMVEAIDPAWIAELRALLDEGICELVGSGAVQLIGPLVPAAVNAANQRLGVAAYQRLLGHRPRLALINEQAYADGLVRHYLDAGYAAIAVEWDNAAAAHPEWPSGRRYLPQYAEGPEGERLPLVWNQSIAFQKFQRYVHGELDLDEYLAYVLQHAGDSARAWSLYGNDVEIFDFRPGRYHTEAALGEASEWERIDALFAAIQAEPRLRFSQPGSVLDLLGEPGAGQSLRLCTAARPVLVKKQEKYNLTRWAVTGRADLDVNTRCWRRYEKLRRQPEAGDAEWRALCDLWSSDFRTHITEGRWQGLRAALAAENDQPPAPPPAIAENGLAVVRQNGRWLEVEAATVRLRLKLQRGLAIDSLCFPEVDARPLLGTLPHGYYDDIRWGADFYSGHLVLELPGHPKLTDLQAVQPAWRYTEDGVSISALVPTPLGPLQKTITVDARRGRVHLQYQPHWEGVPKGSFRLGMFTVKPEAFDAGSLWFATHNGGGRERFALDGNPVDHGKPVSFLVSASHALGLTEGTIELGDASKALRIDIERTAAACVGLVTHQRVGDSYFLRLAFSAGEIDDTCRDGQWPALRYAFTLSAASLAES